MDPKRYRVTISLNFDIDATSEEAAKEIAYDQAGEYLQSVIDGMGVRHSEITVTPI